MGNNEIKKVNIIVEDEVEISSGTQKKRWMMTINNPIFADSGYKEINPSETGLEILSDYYDLSVLYEPEYKDYFDYRCIEIAKGGKPAIVKRPFFRDLDSVEKYFKALKEFGGLKYAIYQYERGECGTPHLQCFIIYKGGKRFKNVKQDFPTAHLKVPNGSNSDNREYCTKKDTRLAEPVEIGEFSEMRARNDVIQFFDMLKLGATNMMLQNLFPVLYAQYGPDKIEKMRQDILKDEHGKKFRKIKVTYIYGPTRLGKTSYVYERYPLEDICRVNNYERGTFEDYQHQKILVLDEFTGKIEITFMNNLLDKFPVNLPARFANRTACFEEAYIISNLPLDRIYTFEQMNTPEVYDAFKTRIKNIIKFTGVGIWHYELKDGEPYITPLKDLRVVQDELPF